MAGGENLGARFSIDISDLKAGLAQANRLMKESSSEFKAAAAGMDDWTDSEDGLNAKLKQLSNTLDVQKEVLNAYEKQYEEAGYAQNDMSKEAVELRTKINNQKAAIASTEKETAKYQKALEELESSSGDAADGLEDVGDAAKDASDGFTVGKGAIATFIGNGLTKLVDGCKNAISSIAGLADETREYREDMSKLDTAFSTTGHTQAEAQKAYEDFYAILGESDRSVEAVNHLAELTNSQEELSKWSTIAAGVTAKFGDSLPIEGLTEAA